MVTRTFERISAKTLGRTRHLKNLLLNTYSTKEIVVLGIESSCDDTCVGIVNNKRTILADSRFSQLQHHLKSGGIIPTVAGELHRENLPSVLSEALKEASLEIKDVSAIAATIGPGLSPSLGAGLDFVKNLVAEERKPFIPVHHMEAHALTARLTDNIPFPFLILLASGGHCILAMCEGVGKFYRLGECLDDSPGEALDKTARALRLQTHPLCVGLSGGKAIEVLAKKGDPLKFPLPHIMAKRSDCLFSFAGLKISTNELIDLIESKNSVDTTAPVAYCEDICASFQVSLCQQLLTRTERAVLYCKKRWESINHLVVSGGVASNLYLRERLTELCNRYDYHLHCPEPRLCTDNGVMIAWTGIEHISVGRPYMNDLTSLLYRPRWPLGEDISSLVTEQKIKVKQPTNMTNY